jgi:putative aldouronate transport system permease protein
MAIRIGKKPSERAFTLSLYGLLVLAQLVTIYPVVLVISMSISDPMAVMNEEVLLWPRGFSLESYRYILRDSEMWISYGNTVFYAVVGTALNVSLTVLGAYTLSRPKFVLRNTAMILITLTMFFSGGLIPLFIVVSKLGMYNTRLAVLLPTAVSVYNLIVARAFFQNVPESMYESAFIDGANEARILVSVYLPLCKAILAVLALFYAVRHWNSYFDAMLFLADKGKQPVQLYLIRVVLDNVMASLSLETVEDVRRQLIAIQLKYSVIVVVMMPIVMVYPFIQRHFVKGIMIGAIKG